MTLEELRVQLDELDNSLEQNFIKRMEIVYQVAEYKRANNLPTLDASREQAMLDRHAANVGPKYDEYIRDYFENVIRISREYQNKLRGI